MNHLNKKKKNGKAQSAFSLSKHEFASRVTKKMEECDKRANTFLYGDSDTNGNPHIAELFEQVATVLKNYIVDARSTANQNCRDALGLTDAFPKGQRRQQR